MSKWDRRRLKAEAWLFALSLQGDEDAGRAWYELVRTNVNRIVEEDLLTSRLATVRRTCRALGIDLSGGESNVAR